MLSRTSVFTLWLGLALGSPTLSSCKKEDPVRSGEPLPALDPETVRKSFAGFETQVKGLSDGFRSLQTQIKVLPDDLIGLREFKEKVAPAESVLGALEARSRWLRGELEQAIQNQASERVRDIDAQVTAASKDLKVIEKSLLDFAHELKPFQDAVGLQTAWTHTLKSGYEVKAAPGGLERKLIDRATDPTQGNDPHAWYRFDRIYFADFGAQLDLARSEPQLKNVAEILKAHPKIQLDLTAFDRDVQKRAEARERTTKRIEAVQTELVRMGLAANRLRVLNHGPDCPPEAPERCAGSVVARVTQR